MAAQNKKITVSVSHRYNADAETIYETFLDAQKAGRFMFTTVTGKMVRAEIDARVGGGFVFVEKRPGGLAQHFGTYTVLERPQRIAFEFRVQENSPAFDMVTIEIKPLKKGCEVGLSHEVSAEFEELKDRIADGWDGILDGLGEQLRTRPLK